jgi:aspartate kinase
VSVGAGPRKCCLSLPRTSGTYRIVLEGTGFAGCNTVAAVLQGRVRVFDSNRGKEKIVVLKLGGSVLTGAKAFRRAAQFLKQRTELAPCEKLVVVVSAQKLATDMLERRARRIVRPPAVRTLDLLWSTGELRSVALLALHLEAIGVSAVGLNVHETGLQFASEHEQRPPPCLTGSHLEVAVAQNAVVVVPGFLATRGDGAIVSLGRGGSDFSAVLLATGLGAERCELVKDVAGYFEDDPHENACTRHLPSLTFKEALQMAKRGCELVQPHALLAASEANLPVVIRSLDERGLFTVISRDSKDGNREPGNGIGSG